MSKRQHRGAWFRLVIPVVMILSLVGLGLAVQIARAGGVAYNVGDVFAGVGNGKIKHFDASGNLLDTLDTGTTCSEDLGMAFDDANNLYATAAFGSCGTGHVLKFDDHGNLIGPFGSGYSNATESIAIDAAQNVYVGQPDGTHEVRKFDKTGAFVKAFSPAIEDRGTDWIDLAADQCTLFYTSEGKLVKRFNVCTDTQLPDFATLPISGAAPGDAAFALRIRPNQDVMVATSQKVFRLNSSGALVQTYLKPASETSVLFAMNLDADQTSFWTAGYDSGNVYKIDITSGTVLANFNAGIVGPSLSGLAVFGELAASRPQLKLTPTTDTKTVGQSETLTAQLINCLDASVTVTFTVTGVNPQSGTGTAVCGGAPATFTYTGNNAGNDTVVATATTTLPPKSLISNSAAITWNRAPTKLVYSGDTTADFHDPATVTATLTVSDTNAPISGAAVSFTLGPGGGTNVCTSMTDAAGQASCTITPSLAAATYPLVASYAGSANFLPSDVTVDFIVTREETTLTYTGPTVFANAQPVTLSGVLKEDGLVPIDLRTVTFTLGSGTTAQTCSGTTDASGVASCTILVNQPQLGPGIVSAAFAGDAFYLPSSDTKQTLIFAFLAKGSFVLGDKSDTGNVTFWSSQWAKANTLSGGKAPSSFKGFADTVSSRPPDCGATWTTRPGNSPPPIKGPLPSYMGVVVASSVAKAGPKISGDVLAIVVVKTDPGYAPNPGHRGTGTVVAVFCQ